MANKPASPQPRAATPDRAAKPEVRPAPAGQSTRLASIDALRGFDMFWIIGGGALVKAIIKLFADPLPQVVQQQMSHVAWEGFTAWDLIMPLFLFLAGTSMPFSFARRLESGQSKGRLYAKILQRVVILWVLGMIAQGGLLTFDCSKLRLFSNTLQAIAVGYLIAAVAIIHLPRWGQFLVTVVLLGAFWAVMLCVPFAGNPAGIMEEKTNLALHIDQLILGRFRVPDSTYAWILPGLGNGATVLLGAMAGHLLRSTWSAGLKLVWLTLVGLVCLAVGWAMAGGPVWVAAQGIPDQTASLWMQRWWSIRFPIIKHLWTSSMVLWAAGWSYLLLALFYLLIDVCGLRRWPTVFTVIGMNAILAYMLTHPFNIGTAVSTQYVAGLMNLVGSGGPAISALASFAVIWLILFYLYRNRHYLRV
jgi:predicted acyltransferase